jgi:hypothetical protein
MDANSVDAIYRRALASRSGPGAMVTLIRAFGEGAGRYSVHAFVRGYTPADVVGAVQQGRRKAIVLGSDVVKCGFPLPFKPKQDRLEWGEHTDVIFAVDDATGQIQGVTIAYELELQGS